MWRIWAYALGRKEGRNKHDADRIAIIRTLIMLQLIITNGFIIAGNVKSLWFDNDKPKQERSYCIKQTTHDVTCYWEYG